jgi:TonB family protein
MAMIRLTLETDGSVSKVELVRSSRLKSWDQEIIRKVQKARFPEATECDGVTLEMSIWPDLLRGSDSSGKDAAAPKGK